MAQKVGNKGLVYAIDARPESIQHIRSKLGVLQKNVILVNCALSGWRGQTTFTSVDGLPGWSSLVAYEKYPKEVRLREHEVQVCRLDDIVDPTRKVKFIKLDIEGGEYDALLGSKNIISKYRPLLVFENGWLGAANRFNYLVQDFIAFFENHHYKVFDILGEPFSHEFLAVQHFVNNFVALPNESFKKYFYLIELLRIQAVERIPNLTVFDSHYCVGSSLESRFSRGI
jgi:FkbM family methyltransferase